MQKKEQDRIGLTLKIREMPLFCNRGGSFEAPNIPHRSELVIAAGGMKSKTPPFRHEGRGDYHFKIVRGTRHP